jgi:hypothetical protein
MEPKNFSTINLTQKEIKDIQQFCNLNKIEDIPTFLRACTWKGYEVEKFGLLGKMGGIQEKRVEIEVIREKRVEIPVEVIKEVVKIEYIEVPIEVIKEVTVEKIVEVIKEIPVDKVVIQEVIKEVPVEKVVTIYDNSTENELLLKIQQLENRPPEIVEVEKIVEIEKEVEKIVEVMKEVVVEKTTTDNSKQKALEETIQKIRTELQLKNKEINDLKSTITEIQVSNGRQGIFLDGSNLNRTLNRK